MWCSHHGKVIISVYHSRASFFFQALYVLLQCNYNYDEAIKKFESQSTPSQDTAGVSCEFFYLSHRLHLLLPQLTSHNGNAFIITKQLKRAVRPLFMAISNHSVLWQNRHLFIVQSLYLVESFIFS